MYSAGGCPSIPPERLLRALLLQILYTIRSERLLMEQMEYNLPFRWFVGLEIDEPVWNPSTFSKNRDRSLAGDVSRKLLAQVVAMARRAGLLSDEHFAVDGTLIEAWASMKSVRPKDGSKGPPSQGGRNPSVDFRGQKRSNATHGSTTDPGARTYRKGNGKEARLCHMGACADGEPLWACGGCPRNPGHRHGGACGADPVVQRVRRVRGTRRITLVADKGYDTRGFVQAMRALRVPPHVAQDTSGRRSAIDGRTTRHAGYRLSQRVRKRIEEIFGWDKTVGGMRKVRHRGRRRVEWMFILSKAAYNLVRMRNLLAPAPGG